MIGRVQLRITPGETVEIVEETAEELVVEATYAPGGKPPPKHFHPAQDEHFTVLAGELHTAVRGRERVLRAGDELDVPRGAGHQMWNPGDAEARVRWATRPAGRTGEWFRALDALQRGGEVGGNGMPRLPVMAALLSEYDDVFRLAQAPLPLLRAVGMFGRSPARRAREAAR